MRQRRQSVDSATSADVATRAAWFLGTGDNSRLVDVGFRQLRFAAAVLLIPYLFTYDPPPNTVTLPVSGAIAVALMVGTLLAINALTSLGGRLADERRRFIISLAALTADAALTVVFVLTLSGTRQDLAWFLLFIPVLEAGMRFGLIVDIKAERAITEEARRRSHLLETVANRASG